ncbi:MAG: 5'-methylthioadenosine/S-adenosylhomocysteine nucleosidase [Verrucomicrobia bacterium]|nr:5'-methylthioadenosine/S-adenosylhomocysteine nucleosidase [Verrucomicrobiota bacterium]
MSTKVSKHKVLFVTALEVETQAVREHLETTSHVEHTAGTIYERGGYRTPWGQCEVLLAQTGAGEEKAAFETERAIQFSRPQCVFFVGIAGGLKDVALLDVVVATKVYGFEYGKEAKRFQPRPEFGESSYRLIQKAKQIKQQATWVRKIKDPRYAADAEPRVFLGPIAAGDKVIASRRSPVYEFLKQHYTDALAVEMEGLGFLRAVHANEHVNALLIRGISDLIAHKSKVETTGSQLKASRHAAALAFAILSQLRPPAPLQLQNTNALANTSSGDTQERLTLLASTLYPLGPQDQQVWRRAGGDPSKIDLNSTGHANWHNAISELKLGGGGTEITMLSLLDVMLSDYPHNESLTLLRRKLNVHS